MKNIISDQLSVIAQTIFDKKGFNILTLDVRGISSMTDYYIIAEGTVDRHVKAISHSIIHALKDLGESPMHVEGEQTGDWVVIDFCNIIVHLFIPDLREKYGIEKLWKDGKIVDVNIVVEQPALDRSQGKL